MKATTQFLVRLDPKLHKALHKISKKTGESLNKITIDALQKVVSEFAEAK